MSGSNEFTSVIDNNVAQLANRVKVPDQKFSWGEPIDVSSVDKFYTVPVFLYVGTGGDVVVETVSGSVLTFKNVADGSYLLGNITGILNSGTTASDLIALRG